MGTGGMDEIRPVVTRLNPRGICPSHVVSDPDIAISLRDRQLVIGRMQAVAAGTLTYGSGRGASVHGGASASE
jgi:hypothetical protein